MPSSRDQGPAFKLQGLAWEVGPPGLPGPGHLLWFLTRSLLGLLLFCTALGLGDSCLPPVAVAGAIAERLTVH